LISLFLAIGLVEWLTMARIVRSQVQSLKQLEFVESAKSIGLPERVIIWRHIIPNAIGPVIVYTTLTIPNVMSLNFLGDGLRDALDVRASKD
jgi:oligopeptide transport system permease protein